MTICQEHTIGSQKIRQIQAIAYDYSGVLFNDRTIAFDATNDTLEYFGKPRVAFPEFQRDFRLPFYSIFADRDIDVASAKEICIQKYRERYDKCRQSLRPFPDTLFSIKTLSEWRLRLAIVSQTPRFQLDDQLIRFELYGYFSSVMACGDCSLEKPDPLPLLETAKRIGVEPENMAFVGDMCEDIECARKAGALSIALDRFEGSYHTRSRLLEARPDFTITSLTELLVLLALSQMREIN